MHQRNTYYTSLSGWDEYLLITSLMRSATVEFRPVRHEGQERYSLTYYSKVVNRLHKNLPTVLM